MKQCLECNSRFDVLPVEREYYKRIAFRTSRGEYPLLDPQQCPQCRGRQRTAFRNQRSLHKRSCDFCKRNHITLYSPDDPRPVICQQCFFSDRWNVLDYGIDVDKSRSFLDQLAELFLITPRLGVMNQQSENSEYCNYSFSNKNCYLVFSSHYEQDCLYGNCSSRDRNCVDYHWLYNCELCYECLFSADCYRSIYLDHCSGCLDCGFSRDLRSCKNCLFCANLRNAEYCVFNEQLSKEEYLSKKATFELQTYSGLIRARDRYFGKFRQMFPFRAVYQTRCENCEGTNHTNSKNLVACFEADKSEDCIHSTYLGSTFDCVDVNYAGFDRCELCYQAIGITNLSNSICVDSCWHGGNLAYCAYCFSSNNCFGCISLQRGEYCILNKAYDRREYEALVDQIISSMMERKEWGVFFPRSMSPFNYRETVAQNWFPLTDVAAKAFGYHQRDQVQDYGGKAVDSMPETIDTVDDSLLSSIWLCNECGKNFRVVSAELSFYRSLQLPMPRNCIDCRQHRRLDLHSPWKLFNRACGRCKSPIQTTFSVEQPEEVICENCFEQVAYNLNT